MKRIVYIFIIIILGVILTKYVLNNKNLFNNSYFAYAFLVNSYDTLSAAEKEAKNLSSSLILKEDNTYKVYTGIYKDIDIVNTMVAYFAKENTNVSLKTIPVSKSFYENLDNYEKLIKSTEDISIYDKINQSILDYYLESFNI